MVIHIVRLVYLLFVVGISISYAFKPDVYQHLSANSVTALVLAPTILAVALVLGDMFWRNKRLGGLSGLFFGLLAGLFIAWVLAQIVDLGRNVVSPPDYSVPAVAPPAAAPTPVSGPVINEVVLAQRVNADAIVSLIKTLLGASAVFMCVSFILQTKDDFRFVIPYVEFSKQTKGARPILLDTSVIIDGRIGDIADTRILESQLVVPRFVLAELQAIADSDDKLKRNRGRRGLDVLNRLQSNDKIEIKILDARVPAVDDAADVDAKLVALGQHLDARVVTNDYNLNKIAQLRGVEVININDLANALKPVVLPGEMMTVKVIKPGEESGQGVGYLEDGTMVVAEGGRDHLGKEVAITVTSVLQTSAGRMIFGRMEGAPHPRRRV
jgi:uncharacterized protein YacL